MNPAELFHHDRDAVAVAEGDTLFHEGEHGDCMYVLLQGSADVFVGETLVESATPGALLGEMALVDSSPRTATVVATMPCRLAKIDERRFHFLVQQTPYFATHVMKVLTERLRQMNLRTKATSAG
ncbi:MAG TPA: cyclic nucleotide-binding domain-containing protein [Chthoniobacterales bacterium]|jgi:CRP-like cAMP-binding protein